MDRPVFSGWHYGTVPGSLSAPPRGPALQQLLVAKDGIMHHLPINCTKFGQLILRKIIKIVATRFQIS